MSQTEQQPATELPSCPLPEALEDLALSAGEEVVKPPVREGISNDEWAERLKQAEARADAQKEAWLRAMAEMENLRKRMNREVANARKFALEGFAKDLLPVADNLERAMAATSTGDGKQVEKLAEGVRLVQTEVMRVFQKHGITRVQAVHQVFDPNLHQAMLEVEAPEAAPGTVVQELQSGYLLNERLLRPALVSVAKTP